MEGTKELYKIVLQKKQSGTPVDSRDIAVRLANEEEGLLDYMIQNDLPQVWALLHHSDAPFFIGKNASFKASPRVAGGELKQLLIRKDHSVINDIIANYKINLASQNWTAHPELISEMEKINLVGTDTSGNKIIKVRL